MPFANREYYTLNNSPVNNISRKTPELFVYGYTNAQDQDNLLSTAWAIKAYALGADGLRIWNFEGDSKSFDQPEGKDDNDLIVDAQERFNMLAIASLRLKALRRGQQDVELLQMLALKKGYTPMQMAARINTNNDISTFIIGLTQRQESLMLAPEVFTCIQFRVDRPYIKAPGRLNHFSCGAPA